MKPAILVVDMLKDAFRTKDPSAIEDYVKIVPKISGLIDQARHRQIPVIFACDSFVQNDFFFQGKPGYCIRGTRGAEVIDELKPEMNDMVLPKRRFSAFFKTFLDQLLRNQGADTVVVTGINTEACVYSTTLDAVANDFYAIVLADCSASRNRTSHEQSLNILSRTRLFPVLKVMSSVEFLDEFDRNTPSRYKREAS